MVVSETVAHAISLEIYLPSVVIGGTLITRHHRVSSHLNLRSGDETLLIKNVKMEDLAGNRLSADCNECLLYLKEVLFIADSSLAADTARSDLDQQPIRKEPRRVLVHVSPFWIRGTVHLIPGATLNDLLVAKKRFIPVTEATLLDHPASAPRTLLVNGTKISCLAADDASKI